MAPWKAAAGVAIGATVTVIGAVPTAGLLPIAGLLVERVIGSGLSPWLFVLPLLGWPVIGGGIGAGIGGERRPVSVAVGALAGGFGAAALGAVAGAVWFVLLAGMTPAHTETVPVVTLSTTTVGYGAGGGFVLGSVLGAVGGGVVDYVRGRSAESGRDG